MLNKVSKCGGQDARHGQVQGREDPSGWSRG